MTGLGQQVAAVELRIRRGLLDDEHLDPQLEQLVERGGVKILGPGAAQRNVMLAHGLLMEWAPSWSDTIPRLSRGRRRQPGYLARG